MPTLNISSRSSDWRARRLSNFSIDGFVIDGVRIASVEGFIQGIKFRDDDPCRKELPDADPIRAQVFCSSGIEARRFGEKAEGKFVWWWWNAIPYGSRGHRVLIERAIRAKFEQNSGAMEALLATKRLVLICTEELDKSIPSGFFCRVLTRIRKEALSTTKSVKSKLR